MKDEKDAMNATTTTLGRCRNYKSFQQERGRKNDGLSSSVICSIIREYFSFVNRGKQFDRFIL